MTYPEILSHIKAATGHAPRKSGDGHIAHCPAHKDRTPSLTLSEGKDGRTLVCCQKGCTFDAVVSGYGLKPSDLYAGESEPPAWDPRRDGFEVTATYIYPGFEKLRKEPEPGHPARGRDKTFTVRRPDPDRPGRWLYNLKGVDRPLYRLPEVQTAVAEGRVVFVVEGEKDADNLASLGFVATCNDGGAGKWKPQHTGPLQGARVAILPDHDASGRAHARQVGTALDVVVVTLATLPTGEPAPVKFDVSDWLEAGGTVDALKELVRDAPPFDKTTPQDAQAEPPADRARPSVLDIRTGTAWLEEASRLATPRQLFGSNWHEGETTILFAESNAGKSVKAVQIAQAVASGRSIPGFPMEAEPQPVLYLDFELSAKQFERRYSRDFSDHFRFSPNFHRAEINPDVLADEDAFDIAVREAIEAAVVEHGYRVVVVDNLTFLSRQSQEAKDALPLMRALHRLKLQHGLSMLVLGHTPKRDGSRPLTLNDLGGSRHLANFADAVVGLGRSAREPDVRYLKQLKVRSAEIEYHADNVATLQLEKPDNFLGFTFLDFGPESAHLKERTDDERGQRDASIIDLHAEGKSYREIAAQLAISKTTVQKVIRAAEAVPPVPTCPPSQGAGTGTRYETQDLAVPVPRKGTGVGTAGTPGDGLATEPPEMPRPSLHKGARVRTPDGEGKVLAVYADKVVVHLDGHDLTSEFKPSAVALLDTPPVEAPF